MHLRFLEKNLTKMCLCFEVFFFHFREKLMGGFYPNDKISFYYFHQWEKKSPKICFSKTKQNEKTKQNHGQIIASLYREQTAITCSPITQRFRPESVVWMKYRVAEYEATYYPENLSSKCSSKRFKSQTRLLSDVFARHGLDSRWRSTSVYFEKQPQHFNFYDYIENDEHLGSKSRSEWDIQYTLKC